MSIEVTQRDREAAEPFRRGKGGKYDRDQEALAHAFALHAAPLREALERVRTMLFDEHAPLLDVAEIINAALSPSYPMENYNGSE